MMRLAMAIALGGAVGSVLRFFLGQWVVAQWPRHFYLGTLTVNVLGCLFIGLLSGLFLLRSDLPVELRSGLIVGVLGGFTTFSSFSLEIFKLFENGRTAEAVIYMLASLISGILAVWAGFAVIRIYQ